MNDALLYGVYGPNNQKWSAGVRLGQVAYTPIELMMDPDLPVIAQDPNNNFINRDWITIPHGRIVAVRSQDLTNYARKSIITLANGVDPSNAPSFAPYGSTPFGYAPYHLFRSLHGLPADTPLGVRFETIAMPYTSYNESYNTTGNGGDRLRVGEYVMPYYGSTATQAPNLLHAGKMVRYIGRQVIQTVAATASATVLLSAPFPAFQPLVLNAWDASGNLYLGTTPTLSYNQTYGSWQAAFATAVKYIQFQWGASDQQRIGQIMGIEPVGTAQGINATVHEMTGWFKWVQTNYGAWEFPLILNRRPFVTVTGESVSISANQGVVANTPIIPFRPLSIYVTGTRYNDDGTTTVLTDQELWPLSERYFGDRIHGEDFDLSIATGKITFTDKLSVSACTINYDYETNFSQGIIWDGQGIFGLTDGSGPSGLVGIPPNLDVRGVMGELRVAIL